MNLKWIFISLFVFITSHVNSQNYLVNFTGRGASNRVSMVKVENLTAGTSLTLYRNQILRLIGTSGISATDQNKNSLLIYPNPMTTNSTVMMVYPPEKGKAFIQIYNITGQIEAQIQSYLGKYPQEFRLSGIKNGLHLISISGTSYHLTGKLLCSGNVGGSISIEKISSEYSDDENDEQTSGTNQRSDIINMTYTNGDRLKFTGISGKYSTIKVDVPEEDKTIDFNFVPCFDSDNNNYPIVEIGPQIWMAENLKTTLYNDSSSIEYPGSDNDIWKNNYTGAYAWYNNDIKFKNIYGALYNWYAVNSGNLCPAGWHIPSIGEWTVLRDNSGGENIAASKLKETGEAHWLPNKSTNESGFSALPGGFRNLSDFTELKNSTYFWSSDFKTNPTGSTGWYMSSVSDMLTENETHFLNEGLSVRCLFGEPAISIPNVTTNKVENITSSAATSGAVLMNNGGSTITAIGLCWSTSKNPTTVNNNNSDRSVTGFSSKITGLLPGTTYHIRAFATNKSGTAYGDDVTFITGTDVPSILTNPITGLNRTSAISGGNVASNGGSEIIASGICWSTSQNPTISGTHTSDGTKNGSFSSNITGLTPNTVYYVKSYATSAIGTGYGNEISFRTEPVAQATLTTKPVSTVTSTTAVSGGNISDDGDGVITERGICWSLSPSPTIQDNKTIDGSGKGIYSSNVSGLMPVTTYFIRAYATNSAGTAYGNEISFTTSTGIPILITNAVSGVTRTSAVSGGTITTNGGVTISTSGLCWSTSHNPTISGSHTSDGSKTGSFSSSMSGLVPFTSYYVKAYATNSLGTGYGDEQSFTTGMVVIPTVTTTPVSSVTSSGASSGGNITDDGDGPVTARGVCWAVTASPTTSNNKTSNGTGSGSFSSSISGLLPVTTYHLRAYAINSAGTAYGSEVIFTTLPSAPTLSTLVATDITRTSATSGGSITSNGGAEITSSGICWSTSHNPVTSGTHTSDGSKTGSFSSGMSGLTPNTVYYIRSYAINSIGTGYGNEVSFTTDPVAIPTLTTTTVTSVTTTTASSGGSITDDGDGTITVRGVCWSVNPSPTTAGSKTSNGTGTGVFTSNITGLQPGTDYHVRAYATNSAGTAYGNDVTFTTLATIPTITTTAVTDLWRTYATLGGNITSNGGDDITASGICWSTSHNPTIAGNHTTGSTGAGSFSSTMNNLNPATLYYVRAYATNSLGTAYGNEISLTTSPLAAPSLSTISVSNIDVTTASSGGIIDDDGGSGIVAKGVCWSISGTPTIGNDKTNDGTGPNDFTSNLTGLLPATTYQIRAYATNGIGTSYGNLLSFTTNPIPNTDVTFTKLNDGTLLHSLGNKRVNFKSVGSDNYVKYSSNNGNTYNQGVKVTGFFTEDNQARILDNGTIVLFAGSKIFYSTDNLSTITPCTVLNKDGSPYTLHTPVNPSYPGAYYNFMGGFAGNNGVYVMGNYANNSMGASPVNLYYSLDGITWKVFYIFGQNIHYTDNGTAMGGTGGNVLGDPANPLYARHVHAVNVGGDGNFYVCTGDADNEIHIMKCTYNSGTDKWTTTDLLNAASRTWQRMRGLGLYERNGYLYWGSDGSGTFTYNGVTYNSLGIYKCAVADINDPTKHILLQTLTDACYSFVNSDNVVFAGLQSYGFVYISYDYGETWTAYQKPAWWTGSVQSVWYNQLNKYIGALYSVIIESKLF